MLCSGTPYSIYYFLPFRSTPVDARGAGDAAGLAGRPSATSGDAPADGLAVPADPVLPDAA